MNSENLLLDLTFNISNSKITKLI